jgi:predicted amidohydrolase
MKLFLTQPGTYSHELTRNFDRVRRLVKPLRSQFEPKDILLLPELAGGESGRVEYDNFTSDLAIGLRCYVVAGSHHEQRRSAQVNCGAVADPAGKIICRYEKLRPYGVESKLGIAPGNLTGHFDIDGCQVLVFICADFWYSEVFLSCLKLRPDIILVPTFSISSRSAPCAARSLWKSMAVSRAYEFGVYVGISDWGYPSEYQGLKSSSVAGLADPRPHTHNGFFLNVGRRRIGRYTLDIDRIRGLRQHRSNHAFLSDERLSGNFSVHK